MAKKKDIYPDEIIGTGSGLINPNSEDFRMLRKKILEHSASLSPQQKMNNQLLGIKLRMESYYRAESPKEILPAGKFLKELVEATGVSHKDFAEYIGYKNSNLSALYNGKRRINYDLALKLGSIFKINPILWLNLQNKVELLQIGIENDVAYGKFQLSDLLKRAG